MPAFVITQGFRIGEPTEGILCDSNAATGGPDRRTAVPMKLAISEKTLMIDGDPRPRAIISCIGQNGSTTYLVQSSTKGLRNGERRAALARASTLLQQLALALKPLAAASEEPDLATEGLGLLFNWLDDERDRLTEGARDGSR